MNAKTIMFGSRKGGACKTTFAADIATIAAAPGYEQILIDIDSQGNNSSGITGPKQNGTYHWPMGNSQKPIRTTDIPKSKPG